VLSWRPCDSHVWMFPFDNSANSISPSRLPSCCAVVFPLFSPLTGIHFLSLLYDAFHYFQGVSRGGNRLATTQRKTNFMVHLYVTKTTAGLRMMRRRDEHLSYRLIAESLSAALLRLGYCQSHSEIYVPIEWMYITASLGTESLISPGDLSGWLEE